MFTTGPISLKAEVTQTRSKQSEKCLKYGLKTHFMFDHFGPNITTEHDCSRKAVK